MHFVPLAHKWDHLSNVKLVDSDFRTHACIDLLMWAQVFTSILRDCWQTRLQGMPIFRKIQGSNMVDVTNLTLEQDVLEDTT